MFSSSPNYSKLKTHLRLALNRLKLLEKKKTELTQKARKEIADYIQAGKYERAKIRVEHIIREDYLVEAMEIVEMYCDLLLARFGLITQMKELDPGLSEAISSLLWVAPRMQADVQELKVISDLLTAKYGKIYADACRNESIESIAEKLKHKMAAQSPPKLLIEKYLIEIAKNYNIEYEPDPQVMAEEHNRPIAYDAMLIDLSDKNNLGGGGGAGVASGSCPQPAGFIGYPQPPMLPPMPQLPPQQSPFEYPMMNSNSMPNQGGGGFGGPFNYNIPPNQGPTTSFPSNEKMGYGNEKMGYNPSYNQQLDRESKDLNINFLADEMDSLPPAYSTLSPDDNIQGSAKPKPQPRAKLPTNNNIFPELPNLPSVPSDLPFSMPDVPTDKKTNETDDIDFDDLARRFEELKKRK